MTAFCEVVGNRSCPVASVVDTIELERLYVQPAFQRHGIGRSLLQRAERLAATAGAGSLWLTAWTGNPRALQFYRTLGYEIAGTTDYSFEGRSYENQVLVKVGLVA